MREGRAGRPRRRASGGRGAAAGRGVVAALSQRLAAPGDALCAPRRERGRNVAWMSSIIAARPSSSRQRRTSSDMPGALADVAGRARPAGAARELRFCSRLETSRHRNLTPCQPRSVDAMSSPNASGIWTSTRIRSGSNATRWRSNDDRSSAIATVKPGGLERGAGQRERERAVVEHQDRLALAPTAAPARGAGEDAQRVEQIAEHQRLVDEHVGAGRDRRLARVAAADADRDDGVRAQPRRRRAAARSATRRPRVGRK